MLCKPGPTQKNFFRYPLDLPPSTAGSFGELRPNHFHSGLDFKTNGRTGYPVHAAYDGYVSRLRVQFGGFGNAIYITHPNGFTTVYGHIERFSPELEKLVRDQQYLQQSFEVDFNLLPLQVQYCKDDDVSPGRAMPALQKGRICISRSGIPKQSKPSTPSFSG